MKVQRQGDRVTHIDGVAMLNDELAFDMQVTTSTGIVLIPHRHYTQYATGKGLKNVTVCLAVDKDDSLTYLVLDEGQPIYENTSTEAMACYIDILAVAEKD